MIHKSLGVMATAGLVLLIGCPSAGAVSPPQVDPQIAPPPGTAGPAQPMMQRSECITTSVLPGTDPGAVSPNQLALNLSGAWQHRPKHPAWVHNLRANPNAHIEIGTEAYDVVARELPDDERDATYPKIVEIAPVFAEYQANTTRQIPLFELIRA